MENKKAEIEAIKENEPQKIIQASAAAPGF